MGWDAGMNARLSTVVTWLAAITGIIAVLTTAVMVGSSWGANVQADAERDRRLTIVEQKVSLLELGHDKNHPDDTPLHTATVKP